MKSTTATRSGAVDGRGDIIQVMGDSGEGLIDNEARIQERMEELQRNRERARKAPQKDPALTRQLESLHLSRKEIVRTLESTKHEARRKQLTAALADIDRRIEEAQAADRR